MQDSTKILIKGAIINCGLATAIINGAISFFSLSKAEMLCSQDLAINFLSVALGCGVICPFFGGLILKGVLAKNTLALGTKGERILAKFVPDNVFLGAFVIGLLTGIIVWGIPYALATVVHLNFVLGRWYWIILMGLYSGLAASFAAYFGMERAYFSKK